MAYKIVIRKNGKSHGEMGPYSSQQAAQSDARTIKIRLSEDADVVVQRVEIGGVRYRPEAPKPSASSASSFSPPPGKLPYVAPPPRIAAGGVVINDDGLILVREPLNHFDGYVWSLPKGGVDKGESDEQGALREVEEETGVRAEIVARIPGEWKSTSALNRYFLMRVIENTGVLDNETAQIAFVTYDEAKELLSLTTNKRGRERDLAVLDAGYGLWLKLKHAAKSNPHHRTHGPYRPDPTASAEGAWDRTGPEPVWRQAHHALVVDALHSWKGDPVEMSIHIADERGNAPLPGNGSGKQKRAQAAALIYEMAHNSKPSRRPLYRGSHIEPRGEQSWTTSRKIAALWAAKNNGQVFELPAGTRGLRIEDYFSDTMNEKEWLVYT